MGAVKKTHPVYYNLLSCIVVLDFAIEDVDEPCAPERGEQGASSSGRWHFGEFSAGRKRLYRVNPGPPFLNRGTQAAFS